ncbi:mitochondrial acyl carrier protein [Blastocystis sp. ATCC 50177/Nand II]|uniref:Acyl carrier protein n=1 Tax=Blastocystis sp. subtype 1 (strain ATCC 50177 / NandII) TaxID=478820 RepID=A0A196S4U9_BLAHN|nr:mitochondrial acyl carrier protein [Blastocystis sp. ATCC 50177/Nand II]
MFRVLARTAPTLRTAVVARAFASQTFLPVEEVTKRMLDVVKNFDAVDPNKVTEHSHFINDLKLDSLNMVEMIMAIEDEFALEIADDVAEKIHTVDDAIKFVSEHPFSK